MDEEFPGLVIVTRDDEVLSSAPCDDLARLMSCTHEEADTRMFVGPYMPQMELTMG